MKLKTDEEYIEDLSVKNPNIYSIDEYINSDTNIKHQCLICSNIWLASPANLLNGKGCPKCADIKCNDGRRKTIEQYNSELVKFNIIAMEAYINAKTYIEHKCGICEYLWKDSPAHVLGGRGCKNCGEVSRKGFGFNFEVLPNKATLYVLHISLKNKEEFTKIGITCQPLRLRLNSIKTDIGSTNIDRVDIIHTVENTGKVILDLETRLLYRLVRKAYFPSVKFAGHTETFQAHILPEILENINEIIQTIS